MKCPYCRSSRLKKAGKAKNKYVTKQAYRCPICEHYFVERDGFEDMTYLRRVELKVGKTRWNVNAVDSRMKFNLGTRLVWSKTLEEFDEFFKELKRRMGGQIHEVFAEEKTSHRRGED